jgi:hypothetical protein
MDIYHKICSKCKILKPQTDFFKQSTSKDGLKSQCKTCISEYYQSIKHTSKSPENIDRIKKNKARYRAKNSEKIKKSAKEYYEKNSDARLAYSKEYRNKNRELINERARERWNMNDKNLNKQREYRTKNKLKVNELAKKYQKEKRLNPVNKTIMNISRSIRSGLTYISETKSSKTNDILGCSINEFKNYLSSKFVNGMSFDNYGEWHLDHIIPISFGRTKEEIIQLNHYTNFQPLWKEDNFAKGCKLTETALNHPIYNKIIKNRNSL